QEPFISFHQIINNEMIAIEIVRTLVGSIGLILAMPLATFMAVFFLQAKSKIKEEK
ncbi:MAG: YibE/F family protein, partial [Candidatus Levybacteria bacterium CG10_big_fil_rev_8_21_14_0_10_36_7]